MKLSRISMFYLAGYLVPAGLMLLTMPRLVFVLFFSSQPDAYRDVMPRVAGALTLALGTLVVQMIRLRIETFYPTLVGIRVFLVSTWVWLFVRTANPFFIALAAMVGFGALLTVAGLVRDGRRPADVA
jgi:hypothetical protein